MSVRRLPSVSINPFYYLFVALSFQGPSLATPSFPLNYLLGLGCDLLIDSIYYVCVSVEVWEIPSLDVDFNLKSLCRRQLCFLELASKSADDCNLEISGVLLGPSDSFITGWIEFHIPSSKTLTEDDLHDGQALRKVSFLNMQHRKLQELI